jgi:transposase
LDHNFDLPTPKRFTQDEIDKFIGYIVNDNMTTEAAANKSNVSNSTGYKYHNWYLKNQKRSASTPTSPGCFSF